MFTEKNRKTIQIPELSPHHAETHDNDQFRGNVYRIDPMLELESAKVRLAQTEREIKMERLCQRGREYCSQVIVDKGISSESTPASHSDEISLGKNWKKNDI
ncbi:unnamed protein product [Schistosoma margrebowiei]|uniref:Uncharacterized protein n=1 Tax=Schistosoma margrebowiei TaxID=48269 RepID=A0A183MS36_9TREM|nr:unnamed protein product [Schistosoma margrebowiei]